MKETLYIVTYACTSLIHDDCVHFKLRGFKQGLYIESHTWLIITDMEYAALRDYILKDNEDIIERLFVGVLTGQGAWIQKSHSKAGEIQSFMNEYFTRP